MRILTKTKLPEVIDLFSGCGGLALGIQQAGFSITHGIELMESAVKTANMNLSIKKGLPPLHIRGDITQMDEHIFNDKIGENGCVIIGGPPCQAYSLIGRGKLNSLVKDEYSYLDDKRGYLFEDYLRFVIGTGARAAVMENVRQCVSYGKINVPEYVANVLEKHGYTVYWTILNSADYGVPQIRERMILFAAKGKLEPVMPRPVYSGSLYNNLYAGVGLKEFQKYPHFIMPLKRHRKRPAWITVGEAIGDLPELQTSVAQSYQSYPVMMGLPYSTEPQNEYQQFMRKNTDEYVTGNSYRNTPRDFPIFARMEEGDNFASASVIADRLFESACQNRHISPGSPEGKRLRKKIVPPYSRDKFLEKWKKLDRNKPSHTLVAHLFFDTYSHIHPWEPRGISVREAARLQSFPDDFVFPCPMGDAFKQIGNSVPPLMAEGIGKALRKLLEEQEKKYGFTE